MRIGRDTTIEDLVEVYPGVVRFFIEQGLPCIACGDPVWGTFEEVAKRSGRSDTEIDRLVIEMNSLFADMRA